MNPAEPPNFGRRIKDLKRSYNKTYADLTAGLKISRERIVQLEENEREPTETERRRFAEFYELPPEELGLFGPGSVDSAAPPRRNPIPPTGSYNPPPGPDRPGYNRPQPSYGGDRPPYPQAGGGYGGGYESRQGGGYDGPPGNDRPMRNPNSFNERPEPGNFNERPGREPSNFNERPPQREPGNFNERPQRPPNNFNDRPQRPPNNFNDRPQRPPNNFNDRPPQRGPGNFNDRPPQRGPMSPRQPGAEEMERPVAPRPPRPAKPKAVNTGEPKPVMKYTAEQLGDIESAYLRKQRDLKVPLKFTFLNGKEYSGVVVDFTPFTVHIIDQENGEEVILRKLAMAYYRKADAVEEARAGKSSEEA